MEAADILGTGGEGTADFHASVERVVDDQVMGHTDAMGLHRVALPVVVVADGGLIEVGHPPLPRVWAGGWQRRAAPGIHVL